MAQTVGNNIQEFNQISGNIGALFIVNYFVFDFQIEFEIGDVLLEFMEVSINLILYTRNIYPDGIFKKCQKYGISVMVSDLMEYFLL